MANREPKWTNVSEAVKPQTSHTDVVDTSPWRKRFHEMYMSLRKDIILLKHPPGSRLDPNALADKYSVSRTPVRTVLQRLENEGLAITRHGVGTTVTEIDLENFREAILLRMKLSELVGYLDPLPVEEPILAHLEHLQHECNNIKNSPSVNNFALIDMQLHDCKCTLIGNTMLRRVFDEMYYRTLRSWLYLLPQMDWASEHRSLSENIEMTTMAVKSGDIPAVGYLTRNVISSGLIRINFLLAESQKP